MPDRNSWLTEFENHFEKNSVMIQKNYPWLFERRIETAAKLSKQGFPSKRDEEWRFTNMEPLWKIPFLVDYSKTLVSFGDEPLDGVEITNDISEVFREDLEDEFDSNDSFELLNSILFSNCVCVRLKRGTKLANPILIRIAGSVRNGLSFPRVLFVAEEGSEATVIEEQMAGLPANTLSTSKIDVILKPSSSIIWNRIQTKLFAQRSISILKVRQAEKSCFNVRTVTMNSDFVRNTMSVLLDGDGAVCKMNGIFLVKGDELIDNHTMLEHLKPNCQSRQLYKGIVAERGRGVFNGKIYVHREAQKTDARQTSKNLILSDRASIDVKPQLEIFADDVKCSHGSTVGHIDENALFYLTSRGISEKTARQMLTKGFINEILEDCESEDLKMRLEKDVSDWLDTVRE